ncbi:hypothetical protein FRC11_002639 [Ceratobasidium sp. 423]|nr:hypothetical protein FRC11_002639 [Ceratobasidium sp. 423]
MAVPDMTVVVNTGRSCFAWRLQATSIVDAPTKESSLKSPLPTTIPDHPDESVCMYPALCDPSPKLLQWRFGYKGSDSGRDSKTGEWVGREGE